ncbi:MAG: oxaloacetate decarboxylase [Chloroflexota bacterium]|nr:oxaloacetate decarboxylase [Chloroflexota bacterium]
MPTPRPLAAPTDGRDLLMVPAVYDVIGARAAAQAGFGAVAVSGNALSASLLGMPDMGLLTLSEMAEQTRRIADAVDVPVIADGDTGHGGPLNVRRTVRDLEAAGAAAVHIEDQQVPKRCAYLPSQIRIVPVDEQVARIEMALEARRGKDFLIIARTDARGPLGFEETLRRAVAYAAAGADWVMLATVGSLDEVRKIATEIPVPLMVNLNLTGALKDCAADDLRQAGALVALYPSVARNAAVRAMQAALGELRRTGHQRGLGELCATSDAYDRFLDAPGWQEVHDRYAP